MTIISESSMGALAYKAGLSLEANPFPKGTEEHWAWVDGYKALQLGRIATKKEIEQAAEYDVSRFRRKSNKHYR